MELATKSISGVISDESVRAVYQPIIDLDRDEIVGYEALARGPEGTDLERPDLLFAAAAREGRTADLDWLCRKAAFTGALDSGLAPPYALFVNVEPTALGTPAPPHGEELLREAEGHQIFVEITERALASDPAQLLNSLAWIRARGWGIAIDDVGADPRSLALMPFIEPDVIKLDLRLVQRHPDREIAQVVNAVNATAERSGATILAEGIETEEHLFTAQALGARLGQGWLFGRPGPLDEIPRRRPTLPVSPRGRSVVTTASTPWKAVSDRREPRRSTKPLLYAITKQLEAQAAALGESAVMLSAFQLAERFTPLTRERYERYGGELGFVAALGRDMPPEPAPRVRGTALEAQDPVADEWDIVVVGPHFAGALVALDLGDTGPDAERRFDFVVTYDRDLVLEAAAALMTRIAALPR